MLAHLEELASEVARLLVGCAEPQVTPAKVSARMQSQASKTAALTRAAEWRTAKALYWPTQERQVAQGRPVSDWESGLAAATVEIDLDFVSQAAERAR